MREIRQSGSEGGEAGTNRPFLPLYLSWSLFSDVFGSVIAMRHNAK